MDFIARLRAAQERNRSLLCVGLDPRRESLPASCREHKTPFLAFNREVIAATADLVCAYKPQVAHYAAVGAEAELEATIAYLKERHPEIPVILDAKRGDIGATAACYAEEAFVRYQADAVTVNPYLGGDTLAPFLEWADRGVVILCRTSNPGSGELQGLEVDGEPLYLWVARLAAEKWNRRGNILLVVGATWPGELARVREVVGEMPLLVPGIGAQGGDLAAVLKAGLDRSGHGLIINSSRGVIYAGEGTGFRAGIRAAAWELRERINLLRNDLAVRSEAKDGDE